MIADVIDLLPDIIPEGGIIVDAEQHTFRQYKYEDGSTEFEDEYTLRKSPAISVKEIFGTVNGDDYTFNKGVDYNVVENTNAAGTTETVISWELNETTPDIDTPFYVQYTCNSVISRYIDSNEEELEAVDTKVEDVIDSRQVENAEGVELDKIGKLFNALGERRGRQDPEYRTYLQTVLQNFKGRGRVKDITFAVAGGVKTDPSNVSLNENFQDNEYQVVIGQNWNPHKTGFIRELAELTDPSGVDFIEPVIYISEEQRIFVVPAESYSGIAHPSESLAIFINTSPASNQTISTVGLSTNYLSQDNLPGSTQSETTDGFGTESLGSGTLG